MSGVSSLQKSAEGYLVCTLCAYSAVNGEFQSDGRRVKSTGDEAAAPQASKQRSRREGAEEASVFFARPVKVRKNRMQTRAPLGNGSG